MPSRQKARPVDPAVQAAATNTTLNHALGNTGARQHQWMASADALSIHRSQQPPAKQRNPAKRTATKLPRENHLASNPASPQLANVVSRRAALNHPSPTAVLPSPSPSEEATVDNVPTRPNTSAESTAPFTGTPLYSIAGHTSPRTITAEGLQWASSMPNRPGDANAASTPAVPSERGRMGVHATESPMIPPASSSRGPPQQHPASQQSSLSDQRMSAAMSTIPIQNSSLSLDQQPRLHLPNPRNPVSPTDLDHHQGQVQIGGTPVQPQILWAPASVLSPDAQQEFVLKLDAFIAAHAASSNSPREAIRLAMLRGAILEQDWVFLIIHQYYCCLSTVAPANLPVEFLDGAERASTIKLMSMSLDNNTDLSKRAVSFFASAPIQINKAKRNFPEWYDLSRSKFKQFMSKSTRFEDLMMICQQRNYPPVTPELIFELGIESKQLQRLVFRCMSRYLWMSWGAFDHPWRAQYEQRNFNIFLGEQNDFYNLAASQTLDLSAMHDNNRHRQSWLIQLKQSCDVYRGSVQQRDVGWQPSRQPMPPPAVIQSGGGPGGASMQSQPSSESSPAHRQVLHMHAARSASTPLLPTAGFRLQPQRIPDPGRYALHQAYLKSPVLLARSGPSMLYQFVEGFVIPPSNPTNIGQGIAKWTFHLPRELLDSAPEDFSGCVDAPPVRYIDESSRMFRIRCMKWASAKPFDEHIWAAADTNWIPYSYFTINGKQLQQRKKIYYGKDLPIDITAFVKEGENTLEIAVLRQQHNADDRNYLVAIETLRMKNHAEIVRECSSNNSVSASAVIQNIKHKLGGPTNDDELSIVESHLTIGLFDPFSASKLCGTPVRGKACSHHECFDLETFLQTRTKKGDVVTADQWKCPICNGDARPHTLIVDGLHMEVRQQLEKQGLTQTRAIVMDQSGAWQPKPEDRDPHSIRDPHSRDDNRVRKELQRQAPRDVEVIDLS